MEALAGALDPLADADGDGDPDLGVFGRQGVGIVHDRGFDLDREDVEPTRDDHVLLAVDDIIETVLVAPADIPGMMPAILPGFGACLGQLEITAADDPAARDDLARFAGRQDVAVIIHQLDPHRKRRGAAASQPFGMFAARGRRNDLG